MVVQRKKRGPLKGEKRCTGRPPGVVTVKGKPVPMTMGEIVLYFWSEE
jgi:hypothetical protein